MNRITDIVPLLDPGLTAGFSKIPLPPEGGYAPSVRREMARKLMAAHRAKQPPADDLSIRDFTIPGLPGNPEVAVRLIEPKRGRSGDALLWMHGGGFVSGHHEDDDLILNPWVRATGCTAIGVGYRLSPEHAHPAASDDCYAALKWLASAPSSLGFAARRIAIGGISAGACLAAATALRSRDEKGPAISFQLLVVPCTDNRSNSPSMMTFDDRRQWHRAANQNAWKVYAGGDGEVSPYAAPARATDLSNLPPAWIEVAGLDPLRDEGIEFATRLMKAGVAVELQVFPGAWHASTYLQPDPTLSVRAREAATAALKRAFS